MQSNKNEKRRPKQAEPVNKPQLRLLMLHGYRQNEMAFRERSGGLRKALKNHVAEFVFCEAPHKVPSNDHSSKEDTSNERGWWFSSESSYNALEPTDCQKGFGESLEYLDRVFETQGPFDGILGFSQGACLAGMLCQIANNVVPEDKKYKFINFKFAIIIAGFKSNQLQHDIYYNLENKIQMPTFHMIGKEDKVIPSDMASKLTEYFHSPRIFFHESGHLISVNSDSKTVLFEFLTEMAKL